MNFTKNVFKKQHMFQYLYNNILVNRNIIHYSNVVTTNSYHLGQKYTKRKTLFVDKADTFCSYNFPNPSEIEEVTGFYPFMESQQFSKTERAKSLLFPDNIDPKITEIGNCASVEEVFNFVKNNIDNLDYRHLTQIVISLYDLQNIFLYHYEEGDDSELKEKFFKKLLEHTDFYILMTAIENDLDTFEPMFLSYVLVYLNKLGVSEDNHLMQNMAMKLRDHLLEDFSLRIASRLLRVIFNENSVRPYYIALDLLPRIYDQIELSQTPDEIEDLTICLYRLSDILTESIMTRYQSKIDEMMQNGIITKDHHQLILKVISVFNHPKWRNMFCSSISKSIMLVKDSIESFNLIEMYSLYDIFFKNQEPGDALNAIQRASAKLLHESDENQIDQRNRLRLFSSVIYFSSPINKNQFRNDVGKYLSGNESYSTLLTIRKIYSYLKISDTKLCDGYWNKVCQILKKEKDFEKISRLMESYMYFCGDMYGYRHHAFEHHILSVIQKTLDDGVLTLIPSRYFVTVAFALLSCYDGKLLEQLLSKFDEMKTQMVPIDIFKLSHSVQNLRVRRLSAVTPGQITMIKSCLDHSTKRIFSYENIHPATTGLLIKSAVIRGNGTEHIVDEMLESLKNPQYMSSKIMEYMCFNLYATKALIPEVINKCTEYIVHNKRNMVGFNVEKMLYLLFQLNYLPVYEDKLFETAIDIIIRDQERMSGLGFLHASLSLCFFNRMPKSFVKQIFNVEFLDKLDLELASCYHRDRYPQRVRHVLMQLNRAVCLEYPEYSVPWFHQKYIQEYQKINAIDDVVNYYQRSVKDYLIGVLGKETFLENVVTPYGYEINFVLHLDRDQVPTDKFNDSSTQKIALILKPDSAFTRFYVRLKGKHALMNRHLEILGYNVKIIKRNEWTNLLYAKERIEYIQKVIFS